MKRQFKNSKVINKLTQNEKRKIAAKPLNEIVSGKCNEKHSQHQRKP